MCIHMPTKNRETYVQETFENITEIFEKISQKFWKTRKLWTHYKSLAKFLWEILAKFEIDLGEIMRNFKKPLHKLYDNNNN